MPIASNKIHPVNNRERELEDKIDRLAKLQKQHEEMLRQTAAELLDMRGALSDLRTLRLGH